MVPRGYPGEEGRALTEMSQTYMSSFDLHLGQKDSSDLVWRSWHYISHWAEPGQGGAGAVFPLDRASVRGTGDVPFIGQNHKTVAVKDA